MLDWVWNMPLKLHQLLTKDYIYHALSYVLNSGHFSGICFLHRYFLSIYIFGLRYTKNIDLFLLSLLLSRFKDAFFWKIGF